MRSATGPNSEHLGWTAWNVAEFAGQQAQIEVIDKNNGGFGHILVDDIYFSNVPKEQANWIDWGKDFYAVNSWNNLPDNQRRWIAWMNNWDYGGSIPTSPWRSAMSIPREVSLETIDEKVHWFRSRSRNCANSAKARVVTIRTVLSVLALLLWVPEARPWKSSPSSKSVRRPSSASRCALVQVKRRSWATTRERDRSSWIGPSLVKWPSAACSQPQTAPLSAENGRVKLHIFVDWSSVEVFGDPGQAALPIRSSRCLQ